MSKIRAIFSLSICAAVMQAAFAVAQNPGLPGAAPAPGPVPPALFNAKTIFVANAGADGGLFPHPFSGDPNRGYDQFFAALQGSGQYQLVPDPSQADLVLELRLTAPYGPTNANKVNGAADPLPAFRLMIFDRKSHFVLWSLTESIEVAVLQKTHDRNFDEAVVNLVSDFEAVTHRPPVASR
jgi:hypothetical protein